MINKNEVYFIKGENSGCGVSFDEVYTKKQLDDALRNEDLFADEIIYEVKVVKKFKVKGTQQTLVEI